MEAETHLRAGQLDEALNSLRGAVRKDPADPGLRRLLYQVFALNGQWERALTQLQTVAQMQPESGVVLATLAGALIRCEGLRTEVFAGKRTPIVFGEPEPWMSWLVEANRLLAIGETNAALELQGKAFEAAPTAPGTLNGEPFEWIADADSRLGPMLEAMIEGRYSWVPFSRISKIDIDPPGELQDLIWKPAKFVWSNGGEGVGFIPVRYPGTETQTDGPLRMGRRTEWTERAPGVFAGLGQRLLATDQAEVPLLEVRTLEFTPAASPDSVA
jgi:type VI secretion system protein ImpE